MVERCAAVSDCPCDVGKKKRRRRIRVVCIEILQ
jgi:hypothetical protein